MAIYWHQTWQMYNKIPMKHKSILPDEGFGERLVELNTAGQMFKIYCKPKPGPTERWGHRVIAICDCGRHIPFGRMSQHYTVKCSEG